MENKRYSIVYDESGSFGQVYCRPELYVILSDDIPRFDALMEKNKALNDNPRSSLSETSDVLNTLDDEWESIPKMYVDGALFSLTFTNPEIDGKAIELE